MSTKSALIFVRLTARALVAVLLWCSALLAAEQPAPGGVALLTKYPSIRSKLEKNQFNAPIYLESREGEGSERVDMYGVFNYPFDAVRDALQYPANWCDITSLHINIKACTSQKVADHSMLTLYSGRKNYQPPAEAYPLKLQFRVLAQQPEYLSVALMADEGPFRTKDHRIRLEAAPLDQGKTFIHFSYTYQHGSVARMAISAYFATLARDKVGFSIVGAKEGRPVYVPGVRGAIERNAVRYYLALQTYIDSLKYPETQRFDQRISRWYDLTARYPRQLKEMEKAEYVASKRHEHNNQVALQKSEGR